MRIAATTRLEQIAVVSAVRTGCECEGDFISQVGLAAILGRSLGSNHVGRNSSHTVYESRPESHLDLLTIRRRIRSREQDTLGQLRARGDGLKIPLESQCRSIQRDFDRERSFGVNVANPPNHWRLPGQRGAAL
jgi:hypothetical protein